MKKLFFLLLENIVNDFDKKTALYMLKELMGKWDEFSVEEQEALEEAMDKVKNMGE